MGERPDDATVRCGQCGELVESGATVCAHCGAPLVAETSAAPEMAAPAAPAAEVSSPSFDAGSVLAGEQRRCEWCGEMSPISAERCAHCDAVFPRPEQDAALLRAAEERLRAAQETLAMMQRQRARKGLGRFFGR